MLLEFGLTGTRRDDILSTHVTGTNTGREANQDERPHPSNVSHRTVITAHGGARLTATAPEPRSASVLIVDRSGDTRDVLRTILESRGMNILEAKQGSEGLELLREQHPHVVVLDLEVDEGDSAELQDAFEDESRRNETSLVVLGRIKGANRSDDGGNPHEPRHIIEKPYHYGPLIRTIEQLLLQHKAVA